MNKAKIGHFHLPLHHMPCQNHYFACSNDTNEDSKFFCFQGLLGTYQVYLHIYLKDFILQNRGIY